MDDKRTSDDKFDYNYSAPNSEEKRWIESIRRQYLPQEDRDAKVAEIKALHKKAKTIPSFIAVAVGITGTLILGAGMTLALEWNSMTGGIIVGIIGMAIMFFAYPLHQLLRERGKKIYGDRIIKLAYELSYDGIDESETQQKSKTDG